MISLRHAWKRATYKSLEEPRDAYPLRLRDYFALNVYWFALSFMWNAMAPILLPVLVLRLVDETHKGGAAGTLAILGLLVATIVQPLAGAWTDTRTTRWGKRRPYIVGGTLFDGVFLLAMFFAGDYVTLVVAYLLLQTVSNIAHGPYQAYLTDLVPAAQRGKVSGVKMAFEMVGVIVTALIIGNLVGQGHLLAAFLAIIAVLLVTMLITALGVSERPFDGFAPSRSEPSFHPAGLSGLVTLIFHSRDFFGWLVSRLMILLAINLVRNYVMFFLNDVLRLENAAAETGNLLAILGVAVALVVYPAGALSDRWGRKPLIILSGALGTLGALVLLTATTMPMVFFAGMILGVSIGAFLSVNWAWGADLIPNDAGGRLLGVSNIATAGAGVLAGLGGWMLDWFNAQAPNLGYTALYITAALCYVLGTVIVMGVKDERGKR